MAIFLQMIVLALVSTGLFAAPQVVLELGNKNLKISVVETDPAYRLIFPANKEEEKTSKIKLDLGDEVSFDGVEVPERKITELKTGLEKLLSLKNIQGIEVIGLFVSGNLNRAHIKTRDAINGLAQEKQIKIFWLDDIAESDSEYLCLPASDLAPVLVDSKKEHLRISGINPERRFSTQKFIDLGQGKLFKKFFAKANNYTEGRLALLEFLKPKLLNLVNSSLGPIVVLGDSELARLFSGLNKDEVKARTHGATGLKVTKEQIQAARQILETAFSDAEKYLLLLKNKDQDTTPFDVEKVLPMVVVYEWLLETSAKTEIIFVERTSTEAAIRWSQR